MCRCMVADRALARLLRERGRGSQGREEGPRAAPGEARGVTVSMAQRGTQVVGNVGMYFAAYRLSLMGWNVMPTSRNARAIDLLAYNTTAPGGPPLHGQADPPC